MQSLLKTAKKLSSFIRKTMINCLRGSSCGETVVERPFVVFVVGSPSGISKAERNRFVLKQKHSRNNRNGKENSQKGIRRVVLVVFVVFAVIIFVDRLSIGFGIGIGRRLEALGASSSSFLVVLPVVAEVAATLLPIWLQYSRLEGRSQSPMRPTTGSVPGRCD